MTMPLGVASAVAGGQFHVGTAAETLAEEFAEQLFPVEDRVLRQLDRPLHEGGIVQIGVEHLLTDGHVLGAVVGERGALGVLGNRGCRVVDRRDVDLLAGGRVDFRADAGVVHRPPGRHRADDEVGKGRRDGVAASRVRGRLDTLFGALVHAGLENGALLGTEFAGRDATHDLAEDLAVFQLFIGVFVAAVLAVAGVGALLGALFGFAGLGFRDAIFAGDGRIQGVEFAHDLVVAVVEFLGAGLVGVFLDFLKGFAGLSNQSAPLLLKFGLAHWIILS